MSNESIVSDLFFEAAISKSFDNREFLRPSIQHYLGGGNVNGQFLVTLKKLMKWAEDKVIEAVHESQVGQSPEVAPQTIKHIKCECENRRGETSVMCCNDCGLPTESFWQVPETGVAYTPSNELELQLQYERIRSGQSTQQEGQEELFATLWYNAVRMGLREFIVSHKHLFHLTRKP